MPIVCATPDCLAGLRKMFYIGVIFVFVTLGGSVGLTNLHIYRTHLSLATADSKKVCREDFNEFKEFITETITEQKESIIRQEGVVNEIKTSVLNGAKKVDDHEHRIRELERP